MAIRSLQSASGTYVRTEPTGPPVGTCIVFWDYDTQWGLDRSRAGAPRPGGELEFLHTERLLEHHARFDIPACFAVVGAAAQAGRRPYHDPAQVRRIAEMGHEVGSHSWMHEWIPGMRRQQLLDSLTRSKDQLEQCIGRAVVTFVPPYNQPFDYLGGWSISLSERRERGPARVDLPALCRALKITGYRVCRVAYRELHHRALEWLVRRPVQRTLHPVRIAGMTCLRLNTPCGFGPDTLRILQHGAASGGMTVIYGHPHSLGDPGPQNESALLAVLSCLAELRREGRVRIYRPKDLLAGE